MSQHHDDLKRSVENDSTLDPDVADELLAEIDRQAESASSDTSTTTPSRAVREMLQRDLGR